MTSPPAVIDDIVIVGSAIDDNARVDMSSGVVRAFDARTGKLRWKWEPLPPNVESDKSAQAPNTATWRTGAGNAWSVMAVDPQRDLVFVPTGSPSPDYYGGMRPGDDRMGRLHRRTARQDRRDGLGISTRPPRPLGLRFRFAAVARDHRTRWKRNPGRNPRQ